MRILTKRVIDLVDELCSDFPSVNNDFLKIRKTLSNFAATEGIKMSELLIVDICDKQNHLLLHKTLTNYINKSLESRYAGETTSRVKKLLKTFFAPNKNEDSVNSPISEIPPFLSQVFWAFPLDLPRNGRDISSGLLADRDYREKLPLTSHGQRILRAVLEIIDEHGLTDLEAIFGAKAEKLTKKIKELYTWNDAEHVLDSCYQIRRKLGFLPVEIVSQSDLAYENFPPKLKRQCEVFLQKAPVGLTGDPELERLAALKNVSIEGLKQSTIDVYLFSFKLMMSRIEINYTLDFDITNLMRIDIKTIKDEAGYEVNYMFNPIVDKIREVERNKGRDTKKVGHDSAGFIHFLTATKAIAAYNGIFSYHENFNLACRSKADVKTKEKRKKIKRQTYDLLWVDSEIQRLFLEFKKIIRERSFIRAPRKRSNKTADQNLRKCLFLVMLVTLRYMGVRQQLLRNCVVGKNIIFEKNKRISFYWGEDENKNKVEIYGYLDPEEHSWTHKVVIDVLNLYFNNVYGYTKKISVNRSNNQLLCRLTNDSRCKEFDPNDNRSFSKIFARWSAMFLEFEGRDLECKDRLHTQFFRGICADWLHYNCKVSTRNSASYIGDTEDTLRGHYLSKLRSHNLNDALGEANRNIREMQQEKAGQTSALLVRTVENLLERQSALEKENQKLKEQLYEAT